MYQETSQLCYSSCLSNRITGINNKHITTPPDKLQFDNPAVCIDDECNNYYVQNIMLGTEIVIPVYVLDYYNQSVDLIQFSVQSETHPYYFTSGPKHVLISHIFEGISIIGNQSVSNSTNFSMTLTLNTALYPH